MLQQRMERHALAARRFGIARVAQPLGGRIEGALFVRIGSAKAEDGRTMRRKR